MIADHSVAARHPTRCRVPLCLRVGIYRSIVGAALMLCAAVVGCGSNPSGPGFSQTNLVSNSAGNAPTVDPNLVNPWGLARSPTGPWWVANNQTGVSTQYDGAGNRLPLGDPLAVRIPPPAGSAPDTASLPTGVVYNDTAAFVVSNGTAAAPAQYIFATEDGTIAGWNETVDPTAAILTVDRSGEALYKGLATGSNARGQFLYATNFRSHSIDVYDRTFALDSLSDQFEDSGIPSNYAPFGIQNVSGDLFITYAKVSSDQESDVPGPGNGYVDVFDTDGVFVRRFATQGQLNSPWGIVQAPISFGRFGGAIIIGNFGDGAVNAFNPIGGTFLGQLSRPNGDPIAIPGLWGLGFGNGSAAGSNETLYFTSGPNQQRDGLFGMLQSMP